MVSDMNGVLSIVPVMFGTSNVTTFITGIVSASSYCFNVCSMVSDLNGVLSIVPVMFGISNVLELTSISSVLF